MTSFYIALKRNCHFDEICVAAALQVVKMTTSLVLSENTFKMATFFFSDRDDVVLLLDIGHYWPCVLISGCNLANDACTWGQGCGLLDSSDTIGSLLANGMAVSK